MTNQEFVRVVMRMNPGMFRDDAHRIIQLVFAAMREAITTGDSFLIPGFGSFYPEFVEGGEWKSNFKNAPPQYSQEARARFEPGKVRKVQPKIRLRFRPSKKMERRLAEKLLGVFDGTEEDETTEAEAEG